MILGTQRQAGLGVSTVIPEIDFETFSSAGMVYADGKWSSPAGAPGTTKGLPVIGAAVYAMHPSTEVLCAAYDLKDGRGWRHWRPGQPDPVDLFEYIRTGGLLEAWNVGFERWVFIYVMARKHGWPVPAMHQWRCAMAKARAFALPGKLELAGQVLNTPVQKDADGKRLLDKFSKPRNPTQKDKRLRIMPDEEPEDALRLYHYNHTDIVAEAEVSARVPDLVGENLAFWQLDQDINVRGAPVDRDGIVNCIEIVNQCLAKYNAELFKLTGIDSASKVKQLIGWLAAYGVHTDSLDEENVERLLALQKKRLPVPGTDEWVVVGEIDPLPPICRRVLQLRQAVGSASVKKVYSMFLRLTPDDRLHDLYNFHGARTGRPTGEGPQPTNLPKAGPDVYLCACGRYHGAHTTKCPWCGAVQLAGTKREWNPAAAEEALGIIAHRSLAMLEWVFGDALLTVAGCLRGLYRARPGYVLVSSDYSAIEAVVAAELANVSWRREVFKTHGKIYEASAATAFGVPFETIIEHKKTTGQHHPLRAKGKVNELALGFGGWINSLRAFGAPGDDEQLKSDVLKWRAASPEIEWIWGGQTKGKANQPLVNSKRPPLSYNYKGEPDRWDESSFYFGIEGAIVQALLRNGVWFSVDRLDGTPSGVHFAASESMLYCMLPSGRALHYHSPRLTQSDRGGYGIEFEGYNTNPKNGPVGWITIRSWGSRFFENIVQAVAHDIQRYGMLALEAAGYSLVMHTYDENVSEVPEGFGSIEEFETIMNTLPPWAQGWPIKAAGGWRGKRYRKE